MALASPPAVVHSDGIAIAVHTCDRRLDAIHHTLTVDAKSADVNSDNQQNINNKTFNHLAKSMNIPINIAMHNK